MHRGIVAVIAGGLLLSACQTAQRSSTETIAGANSGVIIGSEVAAGADGAPVGAVEGIFLGADIGRSLQEGDRRLALEAEYNSLEYSRPGHATEWRNTDTGNSGKVVAAAAVEVNKLDCRQYTHTVNIGGRTRVASGIACRQPGGTWRMAG